MDRAPSLPGRYESPLLPIGTGNMNFVATHGRGQRPRRAEWIMVCTTPGDQDYVPGDEISLNGLFLGVSVTTLGRNASQCWLTANFAFTSLVLCRRNSASVFNPTVARWAVRCIAEW